MSGMSEPIANATGGPRSLVAVVLLVIFAACLAWAGVIVHQRTGRPREAGQSILEAIARDGLDRAMPAPTGAVEWFLDVGPEGVLRYEARRHTRGPAGHRLASLVYRPQAGQMALEVWTIANDLSTSEYRAADGLPPAEWRAFPGARDSAAPSDAPDLTFIDQAAGKVTVQRRVTGREHQSDVVQAAAPGNLIPEGSMDAAVRYVARQQQAAMFYSISNSQAIVSGKLQFTVVKMRPVAKDCVEIIHEIPGSGGLPERRYLDSTGALIRSEFSEIRTLRSTRAKVQRLLPTAAVLSLEATLTVLTSEPQSPRPTTATRPESRPSSRPMHFVPHTPPATEDMTDPPAEALTSPRRPWWGAAWRPADRS